MIPWLSHLVQQNHLWIFVNRPVNYTSYLLIRIFQGEAWVQTHKSPPMTLKPGDAESLISSESSSATPRGAPGCPWWTQIPDMTSVRLSGGPAPSAEGGGWCWGLSSTVGAGQDPDGAGVCEEAAQA